MKKLLSCVILVCMLITMFTGCGSEISEKMIVGTWTTQVKTAGVVTEHEYTFNEDGTGVMTGALGFGIAIKYVLDENTLTIITDTPAIQKTYVYIYEFDGDNMILTESNGDVLTLTQE